MIRESLSMYQRYKLFEEQEDTAGLSISETHTENQFPNKPEGLRQFKNHRWKALGGENSDLLTSENMNIGASTSEFQLGGVRYQGVTAPPSPPGALRWMEYPYPSFARKTNTADSSRNKKAAARVPRQIAFRSL